MKESKEMNLIGFTLLKFIAAQDMTYDEVAFVFASVYCNFIASVIDQDGEETAIAVQSVFHRICESNMLRIMGGETKIWKIKEGGERDGEEPV